jgi:hypothetical protein
MRGINASYLNFMNPVSKGWNNSSKLRFEGVESTFLKSRTNVKIVADAANLRKSTSLSALPNQLIRIYD